MITSLPRLRDPKGTAGEILPRLASDRRKKISQVGKVFPKTLVQEEVDEKLDFHCVGLEKDKNLSFPTVEVDGASSSPGIDCRVLTPFLEPGDGTEVTLPELPSALGGRRSSCSTSSPDTPEPLDLLIKGEAQKKSQTQIAQDNNEQLPEMAGPEEVMRSNLEPLIDTLFEEDELFAQDFEEDGLNRVLFIRRIGIYVEIKTKDYIPGLVCTPLFHCPRCKDHWTEFGTVPENCQFARQPTRGPAIHLASNRKPRKRKTKRRLGDIKEGFIVSGSGTVLDQIDENDFEHTSRSRTSSLGSRDYLTSDDVVLEDLNLGDIDLSTKIEAFKVLHADGEILDHENYVRIVADALGFDEQQYNDFARVNLNKNVNKKSQESGDYGPDLGLCGAGLGNRAKLDGETSVRSRLDLSMLDNMTVKDLPERVRGKLLSLLRLQRERRKRQRQALSNKKKGTRHVTVEGDAETSKSSRSFNQGMDNEDTTENSNQHGNRRNSTVKGNRKRRDSQGKQGKLLARRGSVEDISDKDTSGRRSGYAEGRSRETSASGRREFVDSDEEGFSAASRSPSDVLAYKELQSQRRSRKKNAGVKNRSGQPDTPFQRLRRHSMTGPSNSSSFLGYDDGDSDEEIWGRERASRVGSSRAHMSDSRTSYMSDMARGAHVTDSRTSIQRNYRGSARARKDVSFSNLDDQMSYGSLGNDDSIYDMEDDPTGSRSNRARRSLRKKEKGDGVKRPGHYFQSRALGQGSPSMSHVAASFGDTNMTYGSKAMLSQARTSLIEVNNLPSCDSTVVIKQRSSRPTSVKELSQKRNETIGTECLPQNHEDSTPQHSYEALENSSDNMDEVLPLDAAQVSGTTSPAHAREKQSSPEVKKLFKRTFQQKRKPLISLEDLNVIHRLPVSSAFTYSFYELPNQHRAHNDSIKKAAGRIGRRKKKPSGHFRSKSAP